MSRFIVIGIDDSRNPSFSQNVIELIKCGRVFSGGKRHREIVRHLLPVNYCWIDIVIPLEAVFAEYDICFSHNREVSSESIIVFASGDPLFFGFANTIRERMPDAEIEIYPVFNSLQALAHKLLLQYNDMRIVSLTGRPWKELDIALIEGAKKIGLLTDKARNPITIAQRLSYYGYDNYTMIIGERIGNVERERIFRLSVKEVVEGLYEEVIMPNVIILIREQIRTRAFGIPDAQFELLNNRGKMITKQAIRLTTLSMLDLRYRNVFWDIGFCTGSISIEAKLQFPHLDIVAFEKREEGRSLMEINSRRFGTPGITPVIDDFINADLSLLPPPDAVFIGGHGGEMISIASKLHKVIKVSSVIVFNAVSQESASLFEQAMSLIGCTVIERMKLGVDEHNPILVMKATTEKETQ